MLTIQLLGGFNLTRNGEPIVGLTKPRGKSLLAYLLLHHEVPQERAHLAYTFWPETSDRQARTNLRRELHQLRQTAPLFQTLIQSDGQRVQWQMPADSTLDVTEFTHLLDAATAAMEATAQLEYYQAAIDCYHGEFLPGLYDEWVLAKREALNQAFVQTLETVTTLLVDERDYAKAITLTQRLLQHDPLYEAGYAQLMELYAHQHDRARALHTYHSCVTVLERELGVPPGNEIEMLYQRLRQAEEGETPKAATPITETPLVGRKTEWQTMLQTWRQTSKGYAQMLLIAGEAGIGKTRLGEELLEWVNRQGIPAARTRSYAAEGALAYAPVIEWLRSSALQPAIDALDTPWRTELARLLPELLIQSPDIPRPEPLHERWQRQRLFEALARVITVDEHPKLLLIDDLQWCDQETLEWLRFLLRFASDAPFLVLGTVSTEEVTDDHPLHALTRELQVDAQLTRIELTGLDRTETIALAQQEQHDAFEPAIIERIYAESAGNPLFVVEMVRAGYFAAPTLVPDDATKPLPPKVYAVIQHRLAQLSSEARALAGLAATIGRAFSFDLLVAASDHDEATILDSLDELWQRKVIHERGVADYDFSHDRIREAAYNELSSLRRQLLHKRVVRELKILHTSDVDMVSAELAFHCERAGMSDEAIQWYQHAAKVAKRLFAHVEAVSHLKSGLALVDELQMDHAVATKKIDLLLDLCKVLMYADGATSRQRGEVLHQACTLARRINDINRLAEIFQHLSFFYQAHGQHQEAREIVDEHLALIQHSDDLLLRCDAYTRFGTLNLSMGLFENANYAMELAHTNLDQCDTHLRSTMILKERFAYIYSYWPIILWMLGFPTRALRLMQRLLLLAPKLEPYIRPNLPFFAAILYRNLQMKQELSVEIHELTTWGDKCNNRLAQQSSQVFRGWELAHEGQLEAGIALTQQGIAGFRSAEHTLFQTHRLAMLAEMMLWTKRLAEAEEVLQEAFAISERYEERFWDVELHRLEGDLLLRQGAPEAQAENTYQRAIQIAQHQGAKSLELRATMALCRLWQRQGRMQEAHQQLATIYNWFTEGFDTQDLRNARMLLTELSV